MKRQYNSDVSSAFVDRSAAIIGENDFDSIFGSLVDIEGNDSNQLSEAVYEPRDYLQGYLQSAYKTAYSRNQSVRMELKGQWSIIVNPQNHEVLIDCDEDRLRTYCQQPVSKPISVKPVKNTKPVKEEKFSHSQTMESFLWKVALWSSRGRIPADIDPKQPVSLIRWPNVTRCVITPHSLHISALLAESPHSLLRVAEILKIRQQYVFAFFSAVYALGYVKHEGKKRQVHERSDSIVRKSDPGIKKASRGKISRKSKRKIEKEAKKEVKKQPKGILARIFRLFRRPT